MKALLAAFALLLPSLAHAFTLDVQGTSIEAASFGSPRAAATLVYLTGFADTFDNHEALLAGFVAQGYHVVTFDYPGHGNSGGDIRWWSLKDLASIIPAVLADSRAGFREGSPIVLAGWSTGGTISLRVAQAWDSQVLPEGSRLAGVIAFAPALPARVVIHVNKGDLTSGSMKHDPKPSSVPVVGAFAASITLESKLAAAESVPAGIPTLVLVGGDSEDQFAHSALAARWVRTSAANVVGFQCAGAKHGLEFEPGVGAEARRLAVSFAGSLSRGSSFAADSAACPRISK